MKTISSVLILLFLASCRDHKVELFEAGLFLNLHSAFEIKVTGKSYLNTHQPIERPYNTWQALAEFKVPDQLALHQGRFCLVYRVPFKEIKGHLKLIEMQTTKSCASVYDDKALVELKEIEELEIYHSQEKLLAQDKKKVLDPFTFNLLVTVSGGEQWVSFPLLNLKGKRKFELYGSAMRPSYNSGVSFWPFSGVKATLNARKGAKAYVGTLKDRYVDRKLTICEQVNDDCSIKGESSCDRCRYGWFEVVGSKCKSKRTKLCAPNHCGEKGEPACVRGDATIKEFGCVGGSKAGFCRPGLGTYCDGNGILICL